MRRTLLTATGWTAFIFAIYVFLGFRPAPPDTIGEGEICYRCHRVIADARLAAEIMDRNLPTKYKTSGCMATLRGRPSRATVPRYYVTDFASGGLIEAEHAFFVPVLINDKTNERDYRAYSRAAWPTSPHRCSASSVVRWDTVVERARRRA